MLGKQFTILWVKREEVAGGWRRLHNEELSNFLYASAIIIGETTPRRMRFQGHAARMGEMTNVYKIWAVSQYDLICKA
jgi:hypothetical protein